MNIGHAVLEEIIKQGMVQLAHPKLEEAVVFSWNANSEDQIAGAVAAELRKCGHPENRIFRCGEYHWCESCGAIRSMNAWIHPKLI